MRNFLTQKSLATGVVLALLFSVAGLINLSSESLSQVAQLPAGPSLHEVSYDDAPIFFYLFTHTEDHINHELSEERYQRVGPMIEALDEAYPDLNINWTIQFQGADAATVAERNSQTGVADYLRSLNAEGLVEFGYHAHHDPTYNNRPQRELSTDYTWEEAYDAIHTWITCEKDPLYGGCVSPSGGGLQAILNDFGEVEIVTGVGLTEGALIERSAGSAAIEDELPGRLLNFGFPDHGAVITDPVYVQTRDRLMEILTPTGDTGSSLFWMDNVLCINDGAPIDGVGNIDIKEGIGAVELFIENVERTRPLVIKGGLASKYLYTRNGTSPTIWAYGHPDDPELPSEWLNEPNQKERNYVQTEQALNRLAQYAEQIDSRFIDSNSVIELFTSDDYWNVDDSELEQIALWLVDNWDGAPPPYAYDGLDYYSLTDAFFLLVAALQNEPATGLVSAKIGPWSMRAPSTAAINISTEELLDWAEGFDLSDPIPDLIRIGPRAFSPAQMLYALAFYYASTANNIPSDVVRIPQMNSVPETYALLEAIGCEDCLDTVWSLKPARFQNVSE